MTGSIPGRDRDFFSVTASRPVLGPTQWVPGSLSLRVKLSGCKADHSPPSNAEVKNVWCYTYTLSYVFLACLVKYSIWFHGVVLRHRDNCTFTYTFTLFLPSSSS